MSNIDHISAAELKDSRGNSTICVTVSSDASVGTFAVPSGASTGAHEMPEARDEGGGVHMALQQLEEIVGPAFVGMSVESQKEVDEKLRELAQAHNLGSNTTIGTSIAVTRAAAQANGVVLHKYLQSLEDICPSQKTPHLILNLINGGAHADNGGWIQEHWVVPKTQNVQEAYEQGLQIQQALEKLLQEHRKGDEGGVIVADVPASNRFALLRQAVGDMDTVLGADIAASNFYTKGKYVFDGQSYTPDEYLQFIDKFIQQHNLMLVEDPFHEDDFESFASLARNHKDVIVVGDDLTTTDTKRLNVAVKTESINGVIIKPNQIGTLSETLAAMKYARDNDVHCIVSHRSGETEDTFIADLAYAFGCFGLKAGAPGQIERDVKYQRLIEIAS